MEPDSESCALRWHLWDTHLNRATEKSISVIGIFPNAFCMCLYHREKCVVIVEILSPWLCKRRKASVQQSTDKSPGVVMVWGSALLSPPNTRTDGWLCYLDAPVGLRKPFKGTLNLTLWRLVTMMWNVTYLFFFVHPVLTRKLGLNQLRNCAVLL